MTKAPVIATGAFFFAVLSVILGPAPRIQTLDA